ncbi:MAG TPA: glycoside hydrolase family 9 protein [Panacibacter sp.]|nr:glycoside hydrolase family 9 protein [Panacibacter sp.]HNP46514.1 glycoside hydrolase family 9 protein [Panacibacter sp.]
MKNVCFFGLFFIAVVASAQQRIMMNQVGFYPSSEKIAVVTGVVDTVDFYVISVDHKDTVFSGKPGEQKQSNNSSLVTRIADFSAWQKKGSYVLAVPGVGESYPFKIDNNIYHDVAAASLKAFYFQRMSMPIDAQYAGKWARAEGHPDSTVMIHSSAATAKKPAGTILSSPGGWYDAGDYNKYIVNSGITMGTLLSAYEDFAPYFEKLTVNIPESNDKVPDLLNEIVYNLRWMLTMQDADDGGVYHKCTNAAFDKMIMPDKAKEVRYVVAKSTAATLDFAAVTAQAARVLKMFPKQYPGLGDSCLKASVYAWQWALQHPAVVYAQEELNKKFVPKISTGAYGDSHFEDEWFWAASELYTSTGDEQYYQTVAERLNDHMSLPSWSHVQLLGYYTLIRHQKQLLQHTAAIDTMKASVVAFADGYLAHIDENAFETVIGQSQKDFIWGSNAVAANQSILLINAWLITADKKYLSNAYSNLDYILGRNATGYCFVTGFGTKSTMYPHHRLSIADGIEEPIPGLLAGGPNPGRQDGCVYAFTEPETAYTDSDCAYASNEIAINWNAPLVYLAAAMEALQGKF